MVVLLLLVSTQGHYIDAIIPHNSRNKFLNHHFVTAVTLESLLESIIIHYIDAMILNSFSLLQKQKTLNFFQFKHLQFAIFVILLNKGGSLGFGSGTDISVGEHHYILD